MTLSSSSFYTLLYFVYSVPESKALDVFDNGVADAVVDKVGPFLVESVLVLDEVYPFLLLDEVDFFVVLDGVESFVVLDVRELHP